MAKPIISGVSPEYIHSFTNESDTLWQVFVEVNGVAVLRIIAVERSDLTLEQFQQDDASKGITANSPVIQAFVKEGWVKEAGVWVEPDLRHNVQIVARQNMAMIMELTVMVNAIFEWIALQDNPAIPQLPTNAVFKRSLEEFQYNVKVASHFMQLLVKLPRDLNGRSPQEVSASLLKTATKRANIWRDQEAATINTEEVLPGTNS